MTDLRTKPDARRAYQALDYIRDHPQEHNQAVFAKRTECGTVACLAGHVALLNGDDLLWPEHFGSSLYAAGVRLPDGTEQSIGERAAQLLGVNIEDEYALFYGAENYDDLEREVTRIFGPRPDGAE